MAPHDPQPQQPGPRPPQYRLSWSRILVPLVFVLALWWAWNADLAALWDRVLDALHVRQRDRYTSLALFGAGLVGLLLIVKALNARRS
jgi:hypothetical protein